MIQPAALEGLASAAKVDGGVAKGRIGSRVTNSGTSSAFVLWCRPTVSSDNGRMISDVDGSEGLGASSVCSIEKIFFVISDTFVPCVPVTPIA